MSGKISSVIKMAKVLNVDNLPEFLKLSLEIGLSIVPGINTIVTAKNVFMNNADKKNNKIEHEKLQNKIIEIENSIKELGPETVINSIKEQVINQVLRDAEAFESAYVSEIAVFYDKGDIDEQLEKQLMDILSGEYEFEFEEDEKYYTFVSDFIEEYCEGLDIFIHKNILFIGIDTYFMAEIPTDAMRELRGKIYPFIHNLNNILDEIVFTRFKFYY